MAFNQEFPSLNGIAPSWADIQINASITGGTLLGMSAIAGLKWGRKVELGDRRGASGGRIMARTTGSGSQQASGTFYRSGMRQLIKSLMPLAPTRGNQVIISIVAFDIMIQHTPPGETEIYQVKLKGCRYLGEDDDMKEGQDADKLEIVLNPIEIVNIVNGKEIVLL